MLLEMATGNLLFRITIEGKNDELENLAILLNEIADKMQQVSSTSGYMNTYYSYFNNASQAQVDEILALNLYQYILNHLEEPLPTTRELSKMFNTNEFKLKDTFRHFFKTSIYQFYNDERLKRAYLLIEQTAVPLKEVALISGFNDYINFYKAFKKKFSLTPSEVTRQTMDGLENGDRTAE